MYRLYGSSVSGNCWKPAFLMAKRGVTFHWVEVDIFEKQTRTPDFLAKNPNGRVPLLELPDGRLLAESNAMLMHLGEGSAWIPADAYDRAKMFEWMCFEQYSHEPYIATVRFYKYLERRGAVLTDKIAERTPGGYAALAVMDTQLAKTPFFVGNEPSLADIALYAYTHVAHEGLFDLQPYPALRAWLDRFAKLVEPHQQLGAWRA